MPDRAPSRPPVCLLSLQTFNECFGVLGLLDTLHNTNFGFKAALQLGHGSTMGVSRKEVAAVVRAGRAEGAAKDK